MINVHAECDGGNCRSIAGDVWAMVLAFEEDTHG